MQSEGGRGGGNRESGGSAVAAISPFLIQPICLTNTSPASYHNLTHSKSQQKGLFKSTNPTCWSICNISHMTFWQSQNSNNQPIFLTSQSQTSKLGSASEPFLISSLVCFSQITIYLPGHIDDSFFVCLD